MFAVWYKVHAYHGSESTDSNMTILCIFEIVYYLYVCRKNL